MVNLLRENSEDLKNKELKSWPKQLQRDGDCDDNYNKNNSSGISNSPLALRAVVMARVFPTRGTSRSLEWRSMLPPRFLRPFQFISHFLPHSLTNLVIK